MEGYQEINLLNSPALGALRKLLVEHHRDWLKRIPDLEIFEQNLMTHLMAFGREIMAAELAHYDVVAEQVSVNQVVCRQADCSPETYMTTAGPVQVDRHVYRPAGHSTRHVCPLELQAGIMGGFFTPAAARQAAYVTAHQPPAIGAELFAELGGMPPSASSLERLPKDLSVSWEAHRQEWEADCRSLESVPDTSTTLAVALDGVMAPMRTGAPLEATGKQPKGPQGYQEVGCGTLSLYDADGQRLQTVRYARAPEKSKLTLRQQVASEAQEIGRAHV